MTDVLLVEREGPVAGITLNRPDAGNRVTLAMIQGLAKALGEIAEAAAVRVVVLRGRGDDFCLGRDVSGAQGQLAGSALELRTKTIEPILQAYEAIRRVPVPVVAVVSGAALGFGCALAGACDITLASENARFALPEMEADLPPTLAISALMDRVPMKSLAYLVYSCATVDAMTGLACGLVSRVVAQRDIESEVERLTSALSRRSAAALSAVKSYLAEARHLAPGPAASLTANLLATVVSSR